MASSKDVARLAGVSQPTVSRVLNNPESVSKEKRERVLQAMRELRYQPNLIARSLVMRSTRTIALISGALKNNFFAESTDSIVKLVAQHGYKTIVYFESGDNMEEILESAVGYKVDGILLSSMKLDDPSLELLNESGIPYMLFNRRPRSGGNYVVQDNELAGRMLTEHLLEQGHRHIAFIAGKLNISTFYERKTGFLQAMETANVSVRKNLLHCNETAMSEIHELTKQLLQLKQPPTAIICASDELAITCLDSIVSLGLRVPKDVCLAGFDDIKLSSHHAIQLTSVGQHQVNMGEHATQQLIQMIETGDTDPGYQYICKPELYARRSTAHTIQHRR